MSLCVTRFCRMYTTLYTQPHQIERRYLQVPTRQKSTNVRFYIRESSPSQIDFLKQNEKANNVANRFFDLYTHKMSNSKKIISFRDYKNFHLESFKEYKRSMKEAFPNDSNEDLKKSYNDYCLSVYKLYKLTKESDNDPGTIL